MRKMKVLTLALSLMMSLNMMTSVSAKEADTIRFGSYEQDGNLSNGAEPLEWYAVDAPDGTKTMLICKNIISYSHDFTGPWKDSNARKWLNNEFYKTSFTSKEKKKIVPTTNSTSATSYMANDGINGNVTINVQADPAVEDMVFVLSKKGVEVNLLDREARSAIATPYSQYESMYMIWDAYGRMDPEPRITEYKYTKGSYGTRDAGTVYRNGNNVNAWTLFDGNGNCSIFYGATPSTGVGIRPCIFIYK